MGDSVFLSPAFCLYERYYTLIGKLSPLAISGVNQLLVPMSRAAAVAVRICGILGPCFLYSERL